MTVSLHRTRLGDEFWNKPVNLVGGVFDKEVRRKAQAFAAVAAMLIGDMDIDLQFVFGWVIFEGRFFAADDGG
jgi:hypothetical protein